MSSKLPFKDKFFKLVSSRVSDENHTLDVRKAYLVNIFNLVAILFSLPLGLNALFLSMYPLALTLLGITFILIINHIYLKVTHDQKSAAYVLSGLFFILMTYLVYTGGINQTGPLWIYPLPIILMFLLGFRQGLFYLILFLIINSFILFFPEESLLPALYPYDFKVRIILSFLLVTFLASASEYLLERAFNGMKELKNTLEVTSRQDPLTGLRNRRAYDEDIYNLNSTSGVILMCDIDHFKNINDTYGHTVGDFVLVEVSECIRKMIREKDLAIRWGGEEFFIFLPNTTVIDGYNVSQKLRKSIENLSLYTDENKLIYITMSIGLSHMDDSISLGQAITNADNAMYRAKNEGRNRSFIHKQVT